MICSICNIALLLSKKQGISIEFCPQCNSIWQAKGKLRRAIKKTFYINSPNNPDYISDGQIFDNHNCPNNKSVVRAKNESLNFFG
jgi:Zn-finger nucleic acid-binding protein